MERLEGQHLRLDESLEMMQNFIKLFVIDEGAVMSASTCEWSKKIKWAMQKQDIKRR